jgi:hypothetical protein
MLWPTRWILRPLCAPPVEGEAQHIAAAEYFEVQLDGQVVGRDQPRRNDLHQWRRVAQPVGSELEVAQLAGDQRQWIEPDRANVADHIQQRRADDARQQHHQRALAGREHLRAADLSHVLKLSRQLVAEDGAQIAGALAACDLALQHVQRGRLKLLERLREVRGFHHASFRSGAYVRTRSMLV